MTKLQISANNLAIDDETTSFAHKKFNKIIALLPNSATISLTFSNENQCCRVDANITTPGQQFNAKCVDESYYTCLKHLAETVFRQITRKKDKVT